MSDMEKCIMPEMPYCPTCIYGSVFYDEETDMSTCEWICHYDPERPEEFAI